MVDLVLHVGADGLAGALLSVVLVATACHARPRARLVVIATAALVAAVGVGTMLHTSPWLLIVDWVVVLGSLAILGGLAASRGPARMTAIDPLVFGVVWVRHAARGPRVLLRLVLMVLPERSDDRPRQGAAVLRGLAIAVPVVAVTTALLASGDAVFASFLHLPFSVGGFLGHLLLVVTGSWLGTVLLLQARDQSVHLGAKTGSTGGTTEISIVLAALDLVFALFAAARSVALFRGTEYVQRTTHLTYANYARSGFFQLLAVAAIAAVVLLSVVGATGRFEGRARRRLILLGELGVALTLVIVLAAIRRLGLYQDRFGLTMLRLACTWTVWWLGVVFLMIGAALAGIGRSRPWLTSAVLAALVVGVLAANVADPAAVIARTNVDRVRTGHSTDRSQASGLDIDYLISLGEDAQPILLAHLDELPAPARADVVAKVCRTAPRRRGVFELNLSSSAAVRARDRYCPAP